MIIIANKLTNECELFSDKTSAAAFIGVSIATINRIDKVYKHYIVAKNVILNKSNRSPKKFPNTYVE